MKPCFDRLTMPSYLTLGNHDDRGNFSRVFADVVDPQLDRAAHRIDTDDQCILVLDTLDPGLVSGLVGAAQLEWLAAQLAEVRDRPVIVVMHHCHLDLQSPMDFIRLQDNDALADVLQTHPDIRNVIAGHVHMTTSGVFRGLPFSTLCGSHYSFATRLDRHISDVPRLEGPGQYAIVFSDPDATVVHFENFIDHHPVMSPDLFVWNEDE